MELSDYNKLPEILLNTEQIDNLEYSILKTYDEQELRQYFKDKYLDIYQLKEDDIVIKEDSIFVEGECDYKFDYENNEYKFPYIKMSICTFILYLLLSSLLS